MDGFGGYSHPTALRAVRILRRGWWIILLTTVAVAGAAYYQASRQEALYSASSQVLLKYQNLASGLTGIQDLSTVYQDPQRVAQTQTQIAMSPDVANRVVEAARIPGLTPGSFLGSASVTAATDADILNFDITYGDAETAAKLATIHAEEFIRAPARARHGVDHRRPQGAPWTDRRSSSRVGSRTPPSRRSTGRERAGAPHDGGAADGKRLASSSCERRGADPAAHETRRRARRDARPHARDRARLRPRCPRHACSLRDGDRRQARDDAARADRRSAESASPQEPARDDRESAQR